MEETVNLLLLACCYQEIWRLDPTLLVSSLIQHYRPSCGNNGAQEAGRLPHAITTCIDVTSPQKTRTNVR